MGGRTYLWVAAGLIGGLSLLVVAIYTSQTNSSPPAVLAEQSLTSNPEAAVQSGSPKDAGRADVRQAAKAEPVPPSTAPVQAQGPYDLQSRLETMQRRQQGKVYDPQQVAAAVERGTAWTPVSQVPTSLPLKPEEFTDGRQFIKFDALKMDTLMPGDEMWVRVKQDGPRYRVKIDSVEAHENGRVSSYGHLMDLGERERFSVTFTRGPSLTVGGMDTPDGHYELQAHGENGWIASSALLFKKHQDPIVPPEELDR
jgi:hypothetical protein